MKRIYKILLPALLCALALGGCKGSEPAPVTEPVETKASVTELVSVPEQETETVSAPQSAQAESATKDEKTGETTTKKAKPDASTTGTTKPAQTTTKKAGEGITAAKPSTTKPGATTTKPASTTKPVSTTKPSTTTTKPAGSAVVTTKPSTTKPGETTTKPVAKGNLVSGRMTYLNEALTYELTAARLKQFGVPAEEQKKMLANPDNYMVYSLDVVLENKEAVPVTIYYLDVSDNGKDGIYINGDTSGDLGLPVGGKITNRFFVIAPVEVADGAVMGKVKSMTLRVRYAATLEDDTATPEYVYSKIG